MCGLYYLRNWNTKERLVGEFIPLVFHDMMLSVEMGFKISRGSRINAHTDSRLRPPDPGRTHVTTVQCCNVSYLNMKIKYN